MKLGVNLMNFGPGANPRSLEGWVAVAEGLGFHALMTSDHVTTTADVNERYPAPFYEPLSTLGWLAAMTSKVAIGTTVSILPYRSPLETARAFANIDQLSRGRCILGVGVGWAEKEFSALRVPFRERGAITDDYLAAIKVLWGTDVASYDGPYVQFTDVYTAPRPLQQPHPPIWVGGNSRRAMRRAISYGTAWHPLRIRMAEFRNRMVPEFKALAEAMRRPLPDICPRIRLRITDGPRPDEERLAGEGTVDQIRRDLSELEALDCRYTLLDTYHDYQREELRRSEWAWRMYAVVADEIYDLAEETVR
jgi:probable F420-dependent oxidoreductase